MSRFYLCTRVVVVLLLLFNSCKKDPGGIDTPEPEPPEPEDELLFPEKEMRAVWVTTAWGLDWPRGDYNAASQKQQYMAYLDRFEDLNINAIFFQVKAMGDAYYTSSYEPWSVSITGTRGKNPGYDILEFMISEAHARGIEFHAWMNPYRIATRANTSTSYPPLHESVNPDWVVSHEKIQIYNPALPEVRERLVDIVNELITSYPVDGIHFDDYFYPAASSAGQMVSDEDDFAQYGASYSTIEDFRRGNVDQAINAVYDHIVATRPEVVFSVSPAPNRDYNYNTVFADVTKWCKEGWVDIVIPQLYQEIGNAYNDFQMNLDYWSQYHYEATLMVGHGYYKFGDPSMPAAFQSTAELEKQFELTRRNQKVLGNALYSARYVLENKINITDKLATLYANPAVIPMVGRSVSAAPQAVSGVTITGNELKWSTSGNVRSVVYYFSDLTKQGIVYAITEQENIALDKAGHYCVSTINIDNEESIPSDVVEYE
ncbi:glycoside hydrolase family 10 protein [Parapedobacter sp. 10938]|uniref:glycoside hydrolase family 10 protein n=1 Tax=Parapedobacter flavus TaxID=3110225 RepID=UPI002DB6EFDA|nr:family 10 glycosylhydrolase [Parapedobacter sp. 10938]MEC3880054.1 family 10 glycosylhydrolase [Parapedobacter sp. 10938]